MWVYFISLPWLRQLIAGDAFSVLAQSVLNAHSVVICGILIMKYMGELKRFKAIKCKLKMDAIYTNL